MDEARDPLLAKIMSEPSSDGDWEGPLDGDAVLIEKARHPLRWPILVLACLMLIGSYYCFDIPSALKTQINDYMQDSSAAYETDFALMYTLYAAPNVILPFFGGYFVDRFGVCLCLLVFTSLIAVGQVIVACGFLLKSWPIILIGRFVFALGGENLIVANSALLADWFKGTELAFSFGVNLSVARVGSVVNNILSPSLNNSVGLVFAMWFGAMTCAGSVVCVMLTIPIDRKLDRQIAAQRNALDSRLLSRSVQTTAGSSSSSSSSGPTTAFSKTESHLSHGARSAAGSTTGSDTLLSTFVPRWLNPWADVEGERSPLNLQPAGTISGGGSLNATAAITDAATPHQRTKFSATPLGEDAVSPMYLNRGGNEGSISGSGSGLGSSSSSLHHRTGANGGSGGGNGNGGILTDREREKAALAAGGAGAGVGGGGAAAAAAAASSSSSYGGSLGSSASEDENGSFSHTSLLTAAAPSIQCRDLWAMPPVFWVLVALCVAMYGSVLPFNNIASSLLLERTYFVAPNPGCRLLQVGNCQSDINPPVNCTNLQLSNYQVPLPVDLIVDGEQQCTGLNLQCVRSDVDCTAVEWYTASGSPPGCAQEYCSRQIDALKNAAWVMSIPYTISGIVSPFIGLFIDRYGMRAIIASIAAGLVVVVHLLLGYTNVSPVGPLVGQGLAYTGFAAVLWPAVPLVIQPRLTGLGFGILTSALNAGCAVLPIIVAQVYNVSGSRYIPNVELMFAMLGVLALALGLYLNYFDYFHGNVLNRGAEPKGGWKIANNSGHSLNDDSSAGSSTGVGGGVGTGVGGGAGGGKYSLVGQSEGDSP